jgi:hypothetical protein
MDYPAGTGAAGTSSGHGDWAVLPSAGAAAGGGPAANWADRSMRGGVRQPRLGTSRMLRGPGRRGPLPTCRRSERRRAWATRLPASPGRDLGRIVGEAAHGLQARLAIGRSNTTREELTGRHYPPVAVGTSLPVQLTRGGPDSQWQAIRQLSFPLINSARERPDPFGARHDTGHT